MATTSMDSIRGTSMHDWEYNVATRSYIHKHSGVQISEENWRYMYYAIGTNTTSADSWATTGSASTVTTYLGQVGTRASTRPKEPVTFEEELQAEVNAWLKGAIK